MPAGVCTWICFPTFTSYHLCQWGICKKSVIICKPPISFQNAARIVNAVPWRSLLKDDHECWENVMSVSMFTRFLDCSLRLFSKFLWGSSSHHPDQMSQRQLSLGSLFWGVFVFVSLFTSRLDCFWDYSPNAFVIFLLRWRLLITLIKCLAESSMEVFFQKYLVVGQWVIVKSCFGTAKKS